MLTVLCGGLSSGLRAVPFSRRPQGSALWGVALIPQAALTKYVVSMPFKTTL